jgi:DNA-binding winged helix-turn-helix (wHTH) protein
MPPRARGRARVVGREILVGLTCLSPAAFGDDGSLYRSDDLARTWRRIDHGIKADSTLAQPQLRFSCEPHQLLAKGRPSVVFRSRNFAFLVGAGILTGKGDIVDRIIGLEMGADIYLPKPFHLRELLASVKSVLRRASTQTAERQAAPRSKARFAGWTLDLSSREIYSPSGKEVELTAGEFDLLAVFVNNPNQVLSRARLLDLARNREAGPEDRTIDVQVGRLRSKLEDDPKKPTMIKTMRGRGYIFIPEVEWL